MPAVWLISVSEVIVGTAGASWTEVARLVTASSFTLKVKVVVVVVVCSGSRVKVVSIVTVPFSDGNSLVLNVASSAEIVILPLFFIPSISAETV